MTEKLERRFVDSKIEVRQDDSGKMLLEGRALTYESESRNLGGFTEVIRRDSVAYADEVTATVNHDDERLIGRLGVNMQLENREDGLYYIIDLPDTTEARDLYELSKKGLATSNSFEFIADAEEYVGGGAEQLDKRYINKMTLYAVNPLIGQRSAYADSNIIEPRSYTEFKEAKPAEIPVDPTKVDDTPNQETEDRQVEVPAIENEQQQPTTMDKKELLEGRAELITKLEGAGTADQMKDLQAEVRSIDEKIELIEETKKLALRNFEQTNLTEKTPAMENILNFRSIPAEGMKLDMNAPEVRAVVSSNVTDGKGRIVKSLIEALAPDNIMQKLGAKITYNNYDTVIPISGGLTGTVEFKGENVAAPKMGYSLSSKTLKPKRVPIQVEISKTAVMSDEVGIEADILKLAVDKLHETIEVKFFSADVATADTPAGLLALATTKAVAAAGVSDDLIAENEYALADMGVNNISIVSTGLIQRDLRSTPIDAGSGVMLYDPRAKDVRGLDFQRSAYLKDGSDAKDCALFGDFGQVHMNFFGNTNVTVDPYTKAGENMVVYTFDFNVDWTIAHPAALLFLSNIKA